MSTRTVTRIRRSNAHPSSDGRQSTGRLATADHPRSTRPSGQSARSRSAPPPGSAAPRPASRSAPQSRSAAARPFASKLDRRAAARALVRRRARAEPADRSSPASSRRDASENRKIRYAVIGLGHIAQSAVLPAFANAKQNSTLAALVSDDPEKLKKLGRRYGVDLLCRYEQIDELFSSGSIDAVYVALPNTMHAQTARRASQAGLHVLCEKPMAVSSRDCERMIETARQHHVKLMIAYRLHFEPGNLDAMEIARTGELGDLRFFTSEFTMQVAADNIRTQREMGGGPLYDIGIYCINAARTLFAAEP